MTLNNTNDLLKLQQLLIRQFGSVPDNLIIESAEIINELPNNTNQVTHDVKIYGIKVMKQTAEVF